jgi:hypothetical protein
VLATSLTLATPSASQAHGERGFGLGIQVGNGYFNYHSGGYGYCPPYDQGWAGVYGGGYRGPYGYGDFGGFSGRGYYPRYGGFYDRPVIRHPTTLHWTPDRGYHDHGHLHVPHRRHYHTIPY